MTCLCGVAVDTPGENLRLWMRLPVLGWGNSAKRAAPSPVRGGAPLLAVDTQEGADLGPRVVIHNPQLLLPPLKNLNLVGTEGEERG